MSNRIEDFSRSELEFRKKKQDSLHASLLQLKSSLDAKEYEEAIFYNIYGTNILASLVDANVALPRENDMLDVLRDNIFNILRLQGRHQ